MMKQIDWDSVAERLDAESDFWMKDGNMARDAYNPTAASSLYGAARVLLSMAISIRAGLNGGDDE